MKDPEQLVERISFLSLLWFVRPSPLGSRTGTAVIMIKSYYRRTEHTHAFTVRYPMIITGGAVPRGARINLSKVRCTRKQTLALSYRRHRIIVPFQTPGLSFLTAMPFICTAKRTVCTRADWIIVFHLESTSRASSSPPWFRCVHRAHHSAEEICAVVTLQTSTFFCGEAASRAFHTRHF